MADAFPLAWPDGWPRTTPVEWKNGATAFKRQVDNGRYKSAQPWTFAAARDALMDEIWKHQPTSVVLSTNFQPGKHGPQEGRRRPTDEGVAVYFQRKGRPYVMACDRYADAEGNMRSLALALEAMRQLERHGGGVMMERAYEGFAALPAPPNCWEVLGLSPAANTADVDEAFRRLAKTAHPDRGGSNALMAQLTEAKTNAVRLIEARG